MMCVCHVYICACSYCFALPFITNSLILRGQQHGHIGFPDQRRKINVVSNNTSEFVHIQFHVSNQFQHTPAAVSTTLAKRAHDQVWLRSKLVPVPSEVLSDILYCAEANMRGGDKQLCNDARLPLRRQQKNLLTSSKDFSQEATNDYVTITTAAAAQK